MLDVIHASFHFKRFFAIILFILPSLFLIPFSRFLILPSLFLFLILPSLFLFLILPSLFPSLILPSLFPSLFPIPTL
jgi:hypothetical protein